MKAGTYGKNLFNSVRVKAPKSNTFDLSHSHKTTGSFGWLIPVDFVEVGPAETHRLGNEVLVRAQPMIFPLIDRINVFTHSFFVPYRLLWDNWDEFISNQQVAGNTPVIPTITVDATTSPEEQKFMDYFGVPPRDQQAGATDAEVINAFAFAAYQKIYNDYYRDQQLIDEVDYQLIDGDNTSNNQLYTMRRRALEHDYFTSARIDAQYGEQVDIPLGVVELADDWGQGGVGDYPFFETLGGGSATGNVVQNAGPEVDVGATGPTAWNPNGSLVVGPTGVNALAAAIRIQRLLERFNVSGNRYIEVIKANFNVEAGDARLQRPEYITGTKLPIVINQVLSTVNTDDIPQGNFSGNGMAAGAGYNGSFFSREFGCIVTIMSIMPRTTYANGIPRHFLRRLWTDFPWPEMAHLGEQAIQNREIYAYRSGGGNTFGYTPRFADKRYIPSRVSGDMRDGGFEAWHLARIFTDVPTLSAEFIECDAAEYGRIFAVDSNFDQFVIHIVFKHVARMPFPVYGTPMF